MGVDKFENLGVSGSEILKLRVLNISVNLSTGCYQTSILSFVRRADELPVSVRSNEILN